MKIKKAVVVAFVLLALGAVGFRAMFNAKPVLAKSPKEVLLFGCILNPNGDSFTYQGSTGTTVTATTCSQALADAENAGFTIHSVTPGYQNGEGNFYTLMKGGD